MDGNFDTADETIIPASGKQRQHTDLAGYSRSALNAQLQLANYATQLTPDMFGLVAGHAGELVRLQRYTPIILGRQGSKSSQEAVFDLTPYGADTRGVSRVHARVYSDGNQLLVEDMNSRNGTFINSKKLPPFEAHPIAHGDRLRLGNMVTVVITLNEESIGKSILQLSATIATEDSLQFLTEQLTPYLLAMIEVQRVFTGESKFNPDFTIENPIRYGHMSIMPTKAIIEAENISDAVRFIHELQYAQQRTPYRPLPDLIQGIKSARDIIESNPDALDRLTALAQQMIATKISVSI